MVVIFIKRLYSYCIKIFLGGDILEEYYLMWLSRIDGIGYRRFTDLINYFGSAECVWNASETDLYNFKKINRKVADNIIASRNSNELEDWIEELEEKDIQFYSIYHSKYPKLLKEIYTPPMGLYIKGEIPDDNIDKVSIVGARQCSNYGGMTSENIAFELSNNNIVVVSGMAKGIDSFAHRGALRGSGTTIAVLGCGVDICYPRENWNLMEAIKNNGCIMSEYPPATPVTKYNFPRRNRIVAGLSKILVVVEAGKRSGTLISVDYALESGREVFAVPGNVNSHLSEGTNNLIKQGCTAITEGNDILFELGIAFDDKERETFKSRVSVKLKEEERVVYECIRGDKSVTVQHIMNELDKPIQDVQYMLSVLEIAGWIARSNDGGYIREN